jgi:hypothetical protein
MDTMLLATRVPFKTGSPGAYLPLNVVIIEQAKCADRLEPNGKRQGMVFVCWTIMDGTPPANRKDPTRSETHVEQGKPVTLPPKAGEPQGTLLALRV